MFVDYDDLFSFAKERKDLSKMNLQEDLPSGTIPDKPLYNKLAGN